MRRTLRDLADARKELLEIQQEFVRLEKRLGAVRDCVTDSLTRIFGEEHPAMAALASSLFGRGQGRPSNVFPHKFFKLLNCFSELLERIGLGLVVFENYI